MLDLSVGIQPSLACTQPNMLGLQDNGLLATAKHFPGHGDTETDSHSSLAMIPSDSSRLWSKGLPFQDMIQNSSAIMRGSCSFS